MMSSQRDVLRSIQNCVSEVSCASAISLSVGSSSSSPVGVGSMTYSDSKSASMRPINARSAMMVPAMTQEKSQPGTISR